MSGFGVLNKAILEYIMDLHMIIRMFWYIMIEPVVPGTQNLLRSCRDLRSSLT